MRIITGTAKGFKLKTPRGLDVRPTGDRVKESVFSILTPHIRQAEILDLFAGTGNLGLEALSRGAKSAVFVDNASTSLSIVKENANHTGLAEWASYVKADVYKSLERFHMEGRQFDIIFCDPPYNKGHVNAVLTKLDEIPLLKPEGIFVLEHSRHESITKIGINIQLFRQEAYGETVVSFFRSSQQIFL